MINARWCGGLWRSRTPAPTREGASKPLGASSIHFGCGVPATSRRIQRIALFLSRSRRHLRESGTGPRRSVMDSRSRTALLLLVSTSIIGWSGISFAYRPFDSTDAAVADVGQLEVELGPVGFRRTDEERTIIAPAYVLNFGFVKNWELVLEGRGEHPLAPAEDMQSRFVGDALFFKGVLREGVLQDKSGPSVATEFGALLPGFHDEQGWGASLLGIVSQRWSGGTIHFNLGAALTREQHGDLFIGTIFEGPYNWVVRPVAEVVYERE